MSEHIYPLPENPVYNPEIRALQDDDPASASQTFNPLFEQLIANIHALKKAVDGKAELSPDGKVPLDQLTTDTELSEDSDSLVQSKTVFAALNSIANEINNNITQAVSSLNSALSNKAANNHGHTADQVGAVPITRKVNNKVLSADIALTAADVGAAAAGHTHTVATLGASLLTAIVFAPQGTYVTLSLGGSSVSGTVGGGMELALSLPAVGRWRLSYSYGGGSYAKDVWLEHIGQTRVVAAPSLEASPWSFISKVSRAGLAKEAWRLGDTKSTASSLGTISMQLVGFGQDRLTSPSLGDEVAGMTFIQNGASGSTYQYHGSGNDTACSWQTSNLRNNVFPGIYNSLPGDLRSVIRPVRKYTHAGDDSRALTDDSLWLPSEYELYGASLVGGDYNYNGQCWYQYYQYGAPPKRAAEVWVRTHDKRSTTPYYVGQIKANTVGTSGYDICTQYKGLFVGFCV